MSTITTSFTFKINAKHLLNGKENRNNKRERKNVCDTKAQEYIRKFAMARINWQRETKKKKKKDV